MRAHTEVIQAITLPNPIAALSDRLRDLALKDVNDLFPDMLDQLRLIAGGHVQDKGCQLPEASHDHNFEYAVGIKTFRQEKD